MIMAFSELYSFVYINTEGYKTKKKKIKLRRLTTSLQMICYFV